MTDEHEHAMNVWRDAYAQYDEGLYNARLLPAADRFRAGDQAAAAVIAADRAELVARVAELEECLRKIAAPRRDWETPAKHSEWCRYFARAALEDTRND